MNENNISSVDNKQKEKNIYCAKCGAEMKVSSRYCMKCGNLNYAHPSNAFMRQYVEVKENGGYVSGANYVDQGTVLASDNNIKKYRTCLIVNLFLFFTLPAILFILALFTGDVSNIASSVGIIIGEGILFLIFYSLQCIYIKAGKPWWSVFVPFYGNYVFFEITMDSGWLFLINFVPVVGTIVTLISFYKLGQKFGRSGLLTLFFPLIMIIIIGLDRKSEKGLAVGGLDRANEVDKDGVTKSEKEYRNKKIVKIIIILIIVGLLLYFLWPYIVMFGGKFIELIKESFEFFK